MEQDGSNGAASAGPATSLSHFVHTKVGEGEKGSESANYRM